MFFTVLECLLLVAGGLQFVRVATANPAPVHSLQMPEEYINYTISRVNGSLWAKVDGTYPIERFAIECQDQLLWTGSNGFTFYGDTLPMVYPTPPGTTNISLEVDETKLRWSNYTHIRPDWTHYTALGNWSMISSVIHPILDHFVLKIHYEHPIMVMNGSYTFLYDLNISPYLSPWGNKSTAYFNIRFETGITDLQINTITVDGTLNPVTYATTKEDEAETVTLQIDSEYSKPLLGDLLISFKDNALESANPHFLGLTSMEYGCMIIAATVAVATLVAYLVMKRRRRPKQKDIMSL